MAWRSGGGGDRGMVRRVMGPGLSSRDMARAAREMGRSARGGGRNAKVMYLGGSLAAAADGEGEPAAKGSC